MTVLAHELADIITRMDEHKQRRLLEFAQQLLGETDEPSDENAPTLKELWAMPYEERNRAVAAALARSENDDVEFFETHDDLDFDDER